MAIQPMEAGGRPEGSSARLTHHQEIGVEFQRMKTSISTNAEHLKQSIWKQKHDHRCIRAMQFQSTENQTEVHWKSVVDFQEMHKQSNVNPKAMQFESNVIPPDMHWESNVNPRNMH